MFRMKDIDEYEKMTWRTPSDELADAVDDLLAEVRRLRDILRTVSLDVRPQDMGDSVEWYQKLREEYGGE